MKNSVSNRYSPEFKIEAVELANSLGNVTKAAKEKRVHQNTLRRWKLDFDEGILKDDDFEETIERPLSINDSKALVDITSDIEEKNTKEMVENKLFETPQEVQGKSGEIEKYEDLYNKTKKEVERLNQVNSELNKELSEAQISIGELFTQIRKLKKNN